MSERRAQIQVPHKLPKSRRGELLGVARSTAYYQPRTVSEEDLRLMRLIDEIHLELPFYGSRRIQDELETRGHVVNRKRVQRLMRQMGLRALYPKPHTSHPKQGHKIYPYKQSGLSIERPNQVWAADICYLPMAKGFMYLMAIIDWYSRRVLSWRVSNTLESEFCVEALEEALRRYGAPEIFNTDQGAQFTSEAFTSVLKAQVVSLNSRDGAHPNSRTGAPSPATDPGMLPRHGKTAIRWWSRHDRSYLLPLPGSQVATCVENRNLVWVQVPTRVLVTSCAEAPDGNRPVIPTTASQTT